MLNNLNLKIQVQLRILAPLTYNITSPHSHAQAALWHKLFYMKFIIFSSVLFKFFEDFETAGCSPETGINYLLYARPRKQPIS